MAITNGQMPITNGAMPITNGEMAITNGEMPITNGPMPITKIHSKIHPRNSLKTAGNTAVFHRKRPVNNYFCKEFEKKNEPESEV
ncbi:hypothetical protein [Planococcus beigongshangi]|uniref:hypothetical protein n=1 Tax=Planococcus beigongshangi TaxID=2782536 RepID=UPI00193AECFB|nr:hypothetical protein [Planococcus beigongshangi]